MLLLAPEPSEGFESLLFLGVGDQKAVMASQKFHYPNENWNWIFSSCLFFLTPKYISAFVCMLFSPFSLFFSFIYPLFVPCADNKGLPPSYAWAAARPCCLHKFHPVPVSHPWGYRLLHFQVVITGLHGEPDIGSLGLSGCWLHHRSSFPHQYRDVPGHESQVCCPLCLDKSSGSNLLIWSDCLPTSHCGNGVSIFKAL